MWGSGGVGVHLRSVRCIPTNSHVSTSQEVSEVLCTGSSLPISSHTLWHHSCTKGVGMHLTDLRWTPTPPHGGLEWLTLVFPSWNEIFPCIHWEVSSLILDGDLRLFLEQWKRCCKNPGLPDLVVLTSHALRHHSCTKGFYQTNGHSRWASPQSTNSHFYVSGRLASQKSDSRIVMNSLYTKPQILPVRWKHGNL
jgi:hypothetical protein